MHFFYSVMLKSCCNDTLFGLAINCTKDTIFAIKYCKGSSFLHAFMFSQMRKFVLYVWQPGKGHGYL